MAEHSLKYQPVIYPDGTVAIHETLVDSDGGITSASYEAVRLEATSLGALDMLLRQVYRQLLRIKPITEDELESAIYHTERTDDVLDIEDDEDSNVINLIDYFADENFYK